MTTILWIVLPIVILAIGIMLTLWSREEPAIEREPIDGDQVEVVAISNRSDNAYVGYKGEVRGGIIKGETSSLVWGIKSTITYRLQSDGKIYKW